MSSSRSSEKEPITRRRFLTATALGAAGLGLYSGEFERHHLEITYPEVRLPNLPPVFDGFRMAQLSDIHLDMFTEPYFLRDIVARINRLRPDAVFLTGDFVTHQWLPHKYPIHAAWACARILDGIECTRRYAILGNHDVVVSAQAVTAALTASRIPVLRNSFAPLELDSQVVENIGGREGIRTPGLLVANEALSQLSYSPMSSREILTEANRLANQVAAIVT